MRVVTVPCLKDNYAYLVIEGESAAVVDPGEAAPIVAACRREQVTLEAIWLTHHHWDHVGGVPELVDAHHGIAVIASAIDAQKVRHTTHRVDEGAIVRLGATAASIIHNPGHTLGAISFYIPEVATLFTGDTLFGAGCGRIFEGDVDMMYTSLMKLAALPPETKVYFGHEYTAANLLFAAAVEPDNATIADRAAFMPSPSTPSTIELECATNPFLRAQTGAEFARRREWKDGFR